MPRTGPSITMFKRLQRFRRDESGATAVEYAVMVGLIVITAIGAISQFGSSNGGLFENIVIEFERFL